MIIFDLRKFYGNIAECCEELYFDTDGGIIILCKVQFYLGRAETVINVAICPRDIIVLSEGLQ